MNDWCERLLHLLIAPDPPADCGETSRSLIRDHLPELICKYRTVNDNSLYNLATNTVWMSPATNFRDLLDTTYDVNQRELLINHLRQAHLESPTWLEIRRVVDDDAFKTCLESPDALDAIINAYLMEAKEELQQKPENAGALINAAIDEVLDEFNDETNDRLRETVKVSCFCTNPSNKMMWWRYAGNYSGFCVVWEMRALDAQDALLNSLFPVIYRKERLDLTEHHSVVIGGSQPNPLISIAASICKRIELSHEEEWRLAFPTNKPPWNYMMPKPSLVYLGANMSEHDKLVARNAGERLAIPFETMPDPMT